MRACHISFASLTNLYLSYFIYLLFLTFIFSSWLSRIFFSILSLCFQPIKSITSPPSTKPKPTLDSSFSQAPTKRCRERYGIIQYGSNSFVENALYTSSSASSKSQRLFFFFFKHKVRTFFFLKVEINQLFSLIIFLCELISNASDIDH